MFSFNTLKQFFWLPVLQITHMRSINIPLKINIEKKKFSENLQIEQHVIYLYLDIMILINFI